MDNIIGDVICFPIDDHLEIIFVQGSCETAGCYTHIRLVRQLTNYSAVQQFNVNWFVNIRFQNTTEVRVLNAKDLT